MSMTTLNSFYEWVRRQSGEYQFADNCNCPMANFAREVCDLKFPNARIFTVDEARGPNELTPAYILKEEAVVFEGPVYHSICAGDSTYEALADRLQTEYGL